MENFNGSLKNSIALIGRISFEREFIARVEFNGRLNRSSYLARYTCIEFHQLSEFYMQNKHIQRTTTSFVRSVFFLLTTLMP